MAQLTTTRVGEVTQALCAAGGALELTELRLHLLRSIDTDTLERVLQVHGRFVVVTRPGASTDGAAAQQRVVLAVSPLRLCRAHLSPKSTCEGLCAQLHLCKFMMYGTCKFLKAG